MADTSLWRRAQDLFEQVRERSVNQRAEFLDHACSDDAELRAEVESLLKHHNDAGDGFLRPLSPPPTLSVLPASSQPGATELHEHDPLVGQTIGDCRIDRVIAAGGMGVVYLAEQQQPRRLVALKLLRAGVASESSLRRLEYEAEILARLRHPNIAEIHEAGTHVGLPYFVMEYIEDALPITEYADARRLSTRDRLKLIEQACEAVHYGHQRGVIHRDLKPANILVDEAGRVKVIDFGIARATDADIALTTLQTETGQLIGTLQYMSPEQCAADPHEIDVRSDVYSLGVVLYELLCGRLPYNVTGATLASAARVICEQTPPRPSSITKRTRSASKRHIGTRSASKRPCSSTPSVSERATTAPRSEEDHERVEPRDAGFPLVKGDLERIILKSLEKDRDQRYQSAADLLRDIRHYQNREPIEAKPPNLWTRTLRWVGRHPAWATAMTCTLIYTMSIVLTLASVWYLRMRPHEVVVSPGGKEARLLAVSGHIISDWTTGVGAICDAHLVEPCADYDGGPLAVIGFIRAYDTSYGSDVCAFDLSQNAEEPIWRGELKPADLPKNISDLGYQADEFAPGIVMVEDFFPEKNAGSEVLTVHKHDTYSHCVIRIYDINGRTLYEVWHDGTVGECRWDEKSRLLLCNGLHGVESWADFGRAVEKNDLWVICAIRLVFNARYQKLLRPLPSDGDPSAKWYRYLDSPNIIRGAVKSVILSLLPPLHPRRGHIAELSLQFLDATGTNLGFLSWAIDAEGSEAPGTRVPTDEYNRNRGKMDVGDKPLLPDPNIPLLLHWPPPRVDKQVSSD